MLIASNAGAGMSIGFPDVCKTPVGPATPPIPYPNFAANATSVVFIPTVLITGVPSLVIASITALTFGQEPGVAHGAYKLFGGYNAGQPTILINGMPSISLLMPTNGNAANDPIGAKLVPSATTVFYNSAASARVQEAGPATADGHELTTSELDAFGAVLGLLDDHSLGFVAARTGDGLEVRHVRRFTVGAAVGLQAGDVVLAINDTDVATMDTGELADALVAEPFERVTLRVRRASSGRVIERTAAQPAPDRRAVRATRDADGSIHVDVLACPSDLAWQFDRAVAPLLDETPDAAITLDLRGNPGGDLDGALELASRFLPAGTPMLVAVDSDGDRREIRARGRQCYAQALTLVVDGFTASAAEALAGSLQSAGRARVTGTTTFGKGCVSVAVPAGQTTTRSTDRVVTVFECRLPDDTPITGRGIRVDVPGA